MSKKARELILEALELREDVFLAKLAHERMATFDRRTALTHEQVRDPLQKRCKPRCACASRDN